MTPLSTEIPDVNEPYDAPPYSLAEHIRRLGLAISRAPHMEAKIKLDVEQEIACTLTEADWPRWFAWQASTIDEHGRLDWMVHKLPELEATPGMASSAQVARESGNDPALLEDYTDVEVRGGWYRREGDDLWRLYVVPGTQAAHLANEKRWSARMSDVALRSFVNGLKILRSLDQHEVEGVGVIRGADQWSIFRESPERFFMRASDGKQAALWGLIQKRQPAELRSKEFA